ncbi:hypothetical protein DVJ83_07580 [Deinococcus wulumuqiensis]|uniref:Uncharacterized protein n=1 Tax=Deinococcus wulumuqiensis TaxID=980427 RepID=A0A345IK63_9DEIO|nr:hypothetical protein DVJ83_07580 [Deinococcus wulumuqiensis]
MHLPGESVLDPTGEHHLGHPSGGQGFEHRVSSVEQHVRSLEQFSKLRDARNGTPHHSILSCGLAELPRRALQVRPAPCFALALCELSQSARQKDVASFCQMLQDARCGC